MSKSASRTLYLLAILLNIIGGVVLFVAFAGSTVIESGGYYTTSGLAHPGLAIVAYGFFGVGGLLALIAWVGALIKTAQLSRWGWFVCLILFSGITMLIYIFAGPKTSANQLAYTGYPQNQPYMQNPGYPPQNQPYMQNPGYPPQNQQYQQNPGYPPNQQYQQNPGYPPQNPPYNS